jgi:hypothetical protein
MLLGYCVHAAAVQSLNLITVGCLQGRKDGDITGLQFVRGMGRQTAQDVVVLKAKLQDLQRLVGPEAVEFSRLN